MKKQEQSSQNISGIIPVNKPLNISSFKVVQEIKKSLKLKNAGHSGTLDPQAEGVLVVLAGGATKIVPYIKDWDKEYEATAQLGISTDTDDAEGKVIKINNVGEFALTEIKDVLSRFKGDIEQIPPIYSAKKHKGKAHYKYARNGKEAPRKSGIVNIGNMALIDYQHPYITFKMTCSTGTYVRSICRDLGDLLGPGAILKKLTRTRNGPFVIDNSIDYPELIESGLKSRKSIRMIKPQYFPFKEITVNVSFNQILNSGGLIKKCFIKDSIGGKKFEEGDTITLTGENGNTLGIFEYIMSSSIIDSMEDDASVLRARRIFN